MCTKWTTSLLIAMLAGAPTAWADAAKGGADPSSKTLPAKASDNARAHAFGQNAGGQGGGADPAAKTLPAKASDTAKANAFGQQGDRSKAIHQAAHDAATQQARGAVAHAQVQPATSTTRPAAAATAHASATGVSNGFDNASAGSANGQAAPPAAPGRSGDHRH
jgi:hypothetical protein